MKHLHRFVRRAAAFVLAAIEAEKAALAHREEELQETRKQKQFLEEELERMRQRKVVRMADKVQHVIKRSK